MNITINVAGDLIARHSPNGGIELGSPLRAPRIELIHNPAIGHTKILKDGLRIAAGSNNTDHVAVIDHKTGLMWQVESLGGKSGDGMSHSDCEKAVASLETLGFKDWRLPNRAELSGLIDDSRIEPAIDTNLFPRVKPRWHWTSTPYAGNASSSAWFVGFGGGFVGYGPRDDNGFALAVRRAGQ